MFSLREVSRRLGVPYYRITYAHSIGAVREPVNRFLNKRLYSEAYVTALANHFGVHPGHEPNQGDQCATTDTPVLP